MKRILYLQQNNVVAIISGAEGVPLSELENLVPVGLPFIIIDADQLPEELYLREFRDALTADFDSPGQPNVHIDLEKAKEIAKEKLRRYREHAFQANDIAIRDAMISNNQNALKQAIAQRDKLRDLTTILDNVSKVDIILEKLDEVKEELNIKV